MNENILLEEYENEFSYKKNKSNLNIQFNRIVYKFGIETPDKTIAWDRQEKLF